MTGNRFAALAEDDESVSAVAAADAAPPRSRKPRRRIASPPRNVREPPIFPEEEPFDDDAGPSQHYMVYSSTTIDPSVTKGMYMEWRWPRRCEENPTDLTNPYYIAMIKCGWSAWSAAKKFTRKQSSLDRAPEWCFSPRFGRSRTVLDRPVASVGGYMLEAGTKLFIAGEHEDYYDDDFCIYNDVTVVRPNGEIRIYGYPTDVFPPTDGHSATVVGDKIWIIGSVGYMWTRGKEAQVCILDLATMRMSRHTTTGDDPGWLAGHVVTRVFEDAIEVEVGQEPCPGTTARSGKWTLYTTDFRFLEESWRAVRVRGRLHSVASTSWNGGRTVG
ncbi:uncharacterized protein EV422DRAFT_161097 [Fimicolochytrium jonesii]|uniref:uncharacterized protein n=1 Tax=Fimicolochytrium jonesii TaxID=1396493 RepID=UPI0022FDD4A5|nr:uncharacterized protein EV422DRAFT_161097 [Fimicolochytrium jonesii]KAI8826288.1 hypothetical protein EV422DRAFT_161097 [Fimicolochytrium jonesii]